MRIKDKGIDRPEIAIKYTHAKHLHDLEKVRCSEAGESGHAPWLTDPWGGEVKCSGCRVYAQTS